jgi:hypothetical protein
MKKFIIIFLSFTAIAYSQRFVSNVSKVGTTAAVFLEIPVGGRATAMGGSFVAVANDVSAIYWNPGGIAKFKRIGAIFQYTNWLADTKFGFIGVAVPIGSLGVLGASLTTLFIPDMPVTTVERPEGTGEYFNANDFALGITYARNLTDRFSIGFNVKYIQQRIWHMSSWALAIDVGTLFRTDFFGGMTIGATISNFGTSMRMYGRDARVFYDPDPNKYGNNDRIPAMLETDSWQLPLNFQFGLSIYVINSEINKLVVSTDAVNPSDNYQYLNIGGEYSFKDLFFIRGGYQMLFLKDSEGGLSLGVGIKTQIPFSKMKVQFDYSYNNYGRLKGVNTVALNIEY